MKSLRDVISKSIIVCYKENVTELELQLKLAGFDPIVMRAAYSSDLLRLPAFIRTFMNHRNAWRIAAESSEYTLICEADFVPCLDLGTLSVFWPLDNPSAWGYLYQGSPRLLAVIGRKCLLRGHCAPLVAYVINSRIAEIMLRFYDHETQEFGTEAYYAFDAHLQWWVMGQGGEAYMPARHYGEHGGLPNPEHAKSGIISRGGKHRADNLARPLAFLPQYARGSRLIFCAERAKARAFGWARLLSGRWIVDTNVYTRNFMRTVEMQYIGVRRLLP